MKNIISHFFAFFLILPCLALPSVSLSAGQLVAIKQPKSILNGLKPEHPRLYLTDSGVRQVKEAIAHDPLLQRWYESLEAQAEKMLGEPPAEYKLVGPRLLGQSRAALERISTLAGMYRLDGDRRKAARAREELLTISAFPNWHPQHFLDTAEMTNAAAIGYDWLYSYLSPEDRALVRKAIVDKGLEAGLQVYDRVKTYSMGGEWLETRFNWNQVCNGGLTAGALAVADTDPKIAREVLERARASIRIAMGTFAPDGGWPEGPAYWNYATQYNVFYLAALQTALGTDFGLTQMPGFAETGFFRIQTIGPFGLTFNFADAHDDAVTAPQMFWLAHEFNQPVYALHERRMVGDQPTIFHLIWGAGVAHQLSGEAKSVPKLDSLLPRDAFFHGVDVATFRSDWDNPDAFFVGFKGGDNKANHSHLDLGTFVFDALGERWALDLGPDDYNLPGYWDKLRYTYYRLATRGHNTLTINGENQNRDGKAPIIAFLSTPDRSFAVADLTGGYEPKISRVLRGVALLHRREVLVQDEVEAPQPVNLIWNFHTRARIELHGNWVTLLLGGKRMEARILSPQSARFDVIPADPPPPQAQQPDVHNLIIRLPGTRRVRVAVLLAPEAGGQTLKLESLDEWIARGRVQ